MTSLLRIALSPLVRLLFVIATLALAGCSEVASPPIHAGLVPKENVDGTFEVAGNRYIEVVTGGAGKNDALPLVVVLHGHGGTPITFQHHFRGFNRPARFVFLFGFEPSGRGYGWMPGGISTRPDELDAALPTVIERIWPAIQAIQRARPTVGKPIISGFSQGGTITYGLAERHGGAIAMACPVAGRLPPRMLQAGAVGGTTEVHAANGDADRAIKIEFAADTVEKMRAAGFQADLQPIPGAPHAFEPAASVVFACIERGIAKAR